MSSHGYFKVSRKAFQPSERGGDPFWNKPRVFSEWEAWEYLFGAAARWGETEWALKTGAVLSLQRGETKPLSVRYLETRWKWSKSKVQRFLMTLVQMKRIAVHRSTPEGDTYLIINYETYQGEWDSNTAESGTTLGQRRDKRKKIEAGKEENPLTGGAPEIRIPKGAKRAIALPDDWAPNESHSALADEMDVDLTAEVEQFKDHHVARGSVFKDWDRALNTWLRNARRFNRGGESDRSHLTLLPGGLLDRETADRAKAAAEKAEDERRAAAEKTWQRAVHERFAQLPEAEREAWKDRVRPEIRHLERFPDRHEKVLRLMVFQRYGASIGITLEEHLRAS